MSDFYSTHRDRAQPGHRPGYSDYAGASGGSGWIWGGILLVAVIALLALMSSGGGTPSADGQLLETAPATDTTTQPAVPATPAD